MLVQLFFIVLMLMGVAALCVDMGVARLTQAQMQNAADTAALEGLRQRDALNDGDRRLAVATLVNGANAGPQVLFDDAGLPNADLNAAQTINSGAPTFYPVNLELNTDIPSNSGINDKTGDMVSGAYSHVPKSKECGYNDTDPSCPPDEQYQRNDFVVSGPIAPNTRSLDPSFLVRLRRTDSRNDAVDRNPPVSSRGESLPLLFGRGTVIQPHNNTNNYNPRVDGITVRATAIADARPALRVGMPSPPSVTPSFPGLASFALSESYWRNLGDNGSDTLTIDTGGNLIRGLPLCPTVGLYNDQTQPLPLVVGTAIAAGAAHGVPNSGYVPLFAAISGTNRVIGFGYVQVSSGTPSACPQATTTAFTVTRVSPYIAPLNATTVVTGGFPVQGADLSAVLAANAALGPADGALLAPALVR